MTEKLKSKTSLIQLLLSIALVVMVAINTFTMSNMRKQETETQQQLTATTETIHKLEKELKTMRGIVDMLNHTVYEQENKIEELQSRKIQTNEQVIVSNNGEPIKDVETDEAYVPSRSGGYAMDVVCTYYTDAPDEGSGNGITASGTEATVGRTIACNFLPFGTEVEIDGVVYIVEDRGGMDGNVIDIFVESKEEAFARGRHDAVAYIY